MKPFSRKQIPIFVIPLTLFLLACNALAPERDPYLAPVSPTAPAPLVTDTVVPVLSQQLTLTSIPFSESDPGNGYPKYTITSQTPQLTGSDDPHVVAFNQRLNEIVGNEVNVWRQEFQRLPLTSLSNGSSLDVTYTLVGQRGDIWSFKFDFSFYADMAAHPGLNSATLTYDLAQGRELAMADLFLPGSNFLEVISAYCKAELQKQPYADSFWMEGANPTSENYRLWNVTADGLMITFSQYQVAPGASGPLKVIVPYAALTTILDPYGPSAAFLP